MNITIKEVAQEAGVSIATVSRVLNSKDRVNMATRKKVEEAVKRLNYQPNHIARTMIMKETKMIGLIVPSLDEYWALMSEVIQDELWEAGYALLLCTSGRSATDVEKEIIYLNKFIERKVDGIIYASPARNNYSHVKEIIDDGIEIVTFDKNIPGVNQVVGDHQQGAMIAVEHLIHLGHRRIAYIGCTMFNPDRELGYRNAHTVNSLPVYDSLVKRGQFTFQFGYRGIEELLLNKEEFTAVFCGNDLIAFGVIEGLKNANMRVPQDVAVVGYDDIKMASLFKPALTTVKQPIKELGTAIVELLLDSITKKMKKGSRSPKKLVFPMELIVRESCGEVVKQM